MKIKLKYKKKSLEIDVKKCGLFGMVRGLMFRRREKTSALLLFDFKKPKRLKIHSFFVFFPFVAIWLNKKNKVMEYRIAKPWSPVILPQKKFSRLIEIPINKKYKRIIQIIVGEGKI
jgi:uncharacterized membrane protein (UPF0127 family)